MFALFSRVHQIIIRYDYLSINDDGLLTPNSTVNSITADYTRQMILSKNRRNNTDLIASECLNGSSPRPALAEKQGLKGFTIFKNSKKNFKNN